MTLAEYRESIGLSPEELCKRLALGETPMALSTLELYEKGKACTSVPTTYRIAQGLGISMEEVYRMASANV